MSLSGYLLAGGIALLCAGSPGEGAGSEVRRIPIDPGRPEFDLAVSFAFSSQDADVGWAVWKSYFKGIEKVLAREVSLSGRLGAIFELTDGTPIIGSVTASSRRLRPRPEVFGHDGMGIFWSELSESGAWEVRERYFLGGSGFLQTVESVPGLRPDGAFTASAWQELVSPADSAIHWRLDSYPEVPERFSGRIEGIEGTPFHPALTKWGDFLLYVCWDEYREGQQWISGRQVASETGVIERISPPDPDGRCLNPVPLDSESEGLCVAWLKLTDVIGGDGVVDMIHTAHVARRTGEGKWELVADETGNDEGAVMLNGLLPDLRKGKGYPSGYSGRRRHPMLLDGGENGAWLIWERKSKHSGGGTKTAGQLLGRQFKDGKWATEPLLLHEGLIDYRLAKPTRVRDSGHTFFAIGSEIPKDWKRPSYLIEIDLRKARPIELEDWRDQFELVKLPFEDEPKERYSAEIEGKQFNLYWGDLHCHSGLTGDAEGEPDEIVLYARDRARLDVMVLQDNDEVHGRILTEGEYQLGVTHSQWITEPGKFVALPGYEWTQRTSKQGIPDPYKSAFEQSFPNSYPNHRTIIYPIKGGPIVRYFEVGHDFKLMADTVYRHGGILHSQHPAFDISDHPAETNLEVTACWGIYIRSVPERFHGELNKGRRMGFIGTSDSHRRNPGLCGGLTGIYAEELTPEAIHEALRSHRVFATNGSKIVVDSRVNGKFSDEVVKAEDGTVVVSLFLRGTQPITKVKLMGDGKAVAQFEGDGSHEFRTEKTIEGLARGEHWFYWTIEQEGKSTPYTGNISVARGNLAWSSPHFVEVGGRAAGSAETEAIGRADDSEEDCSDQQSALCQDESTRADTAVRRSGQGGKPNLLMIAIDDLRPMLGCYGDPVAQTPNIDRLAKRGMIFERAYCQFAKCGPSRLSLMTGLRPDAVGVFSHREKEAIEFRERRPDAISMARWFKDHGWHTQGFGKVYHDGWDNPDDWSLPAFPGRDGEMLEIVDEKAVADPSLEKRNAVVTVIAERHACPVMQSPSVPDDALFAGRMTNRVLETLDELNDAETPWFLAVGYRRPHLPFVAPKKYFDRYRPDLSWLPTNRHPPKAAPIMAWFNSDGYAGFGKRVDLGGTFPNPPETKAAAAAWNGFEMRSYLGVPYHGTIPDELQLELRQAYLACVSYVDAQVGRLLDGIADDTIVLLWSDHGWHLGEQTAWGKMTNYELATRVPLIIDAPGPEFPSGRTRSLAELVDLYPTLCDLAGIEAPEHLEGESLIESLKEPESDGQSAAFSQYPRFRDQYQGYAIRADRWRYVSWRSKKTGEIVKRELYDHESDPAETVNVAGRDEHKNLVQGLEQQIRDQLKNR